MPASSTADELRGLVETDPAVLKVRTRAPGPSGALPLTEQMLLNWASGDLFGMTQNAGMGWNPAELCRKEFLILSTSGGLRADDGSPIALGYHTGHWEVGLLMQAAAWSSSGWGRCPSRGSAPIRAMGERRERPA